MLTFLNDNDFLLVDKYKQNDDGSVSWFYNDGEASHSGYLVDGLTREDGENTIDVWAKFQALITDGTLTVQGKTQEEIELEQVANFRAKRQELIDNLVVTISTGKSFDANEKSIQRLTASVVSNLTKPDDFIIEWSTADVGTGIMVDCTKSEIEEALSLATEKATEITRLDNA